MKTLSSKEIFNRAIEALNATNIKDGETRQLILNELINILMSEIKGKSSADNTPDWL